jgi:polyhydroxyalkanoate synthesis regulator phasin
MPPAKRSSARSTSSSSSQSGGARKSSGSRKTSARSTSATAASGAKSTATSARKSAAKTSTRAKSGATRTRSTAKSGAAKTASAAKSTAKSAAGTVKTAGTAAKSTAKTARSGAKATATTAKKSAKTTRSTAKAASTSTRRASGGTGVLSVAEQLAQGAAKPRDIVLLTRTHIQEALDDAASRGRVTRKDANDLVTELVRRGRGQGNDLVKEVEALLGKAGAATKRARTNDSVDRIVRGADRARRAAGVGPSFPILGYDELNAAQVQSRIKDLKKPEMRKVLTYERKNANRKSVVGALEKSLA